MTEEPQMTLDQAIKLLCIVHTRDAPPGIDFTVNMPEKYFVEFNHIQYTDAWEVLRNHIIKLEGLVRL